MKLLMVSGDRSVLQGKRSAFYYTLEEFSTYWDRIDVITPVVSGKEKVVSIFGNVFFHPSPHSLWYQPWWIVKKGKELIGIYHHNVMTVHEYPPFYNGIGARWLYKKTYIPYALEIHHIVGYPRVSSWQEWIGRLMYWPYFFLFGKKAHAVRVVDGETENILVKKMGVPQSKIEITSSMYLDYSALVEDSSIEKKFDLVSCARLVPNKGFDELLKAVAQLSDVSLRIIGDGSERPMLEKKCKELHIEQRVQFDGWLSTNNDVYRAMQSGKLFVMNSKSEGGPRVLTEAMALGIPALSTCVGIAKQLIRLQMVSETDGRTGDLINKIQNLLGNEKELKKLSEKGKVVKNMFSKEIQISAYADFLKDVSKKLRLLIVTQKVDKNDPILGFFHKWIINFITRCSHVVIIGQSIGEHNMKYFNHVDCVSLGKEKGTNRIVQILKFIYFQWKFRHRYDVVLVHMTPIWVVLGAPLWWVLRKSIYLWYEARGTGWPLRVALLLIRKVFSASGSGMPIKNSKSVITGHGIDTMVFVPPAHPKIQKILVTAGRVSRSKRLDIIFRVLRGIPDEYTLMVCGEPITRDDKAYMKELEDLLIRDNLRQRVVIRPCTQVEVCSWLQAARVFLHASTTALDKAVLEAMACGCPVVSTNIAVHEVLPKELCATDENFSEKVQWVLDLEEYEQKRLEQELRQRVVGKHDIQNLIKTLITEMMP